MNPAKQALRLLWERPVLWLPQFAAACINLLLNTASTEAARNLAHRVAFAPGTLLAYGPELRTPDLLVASETVQLPVVLPSKGLQYIVIVAAVAITAALVRQPGARLLTVTRSVLRDRGRAILNAGLLIFALVLLDLMTQEATAAGFAFVPFLRPTPAWALILAFWTADLLAYIAFFAIGVPWILALALPPDQHTLPRETTWLAREWMLLAWAVMFALSFGWGRVEAHFLPPRVDPGPFWRAPITLGGPILNLVATAYLSVAAAVLTCRSQERQQG